MSTIRDEVHDFCMTLFALSDNGEVVLPRSNSSAKPIIETLVKAQRRLRRRYENECSYEWANTDAYRATTERLEARCMTWGSQLAATLGVGALQLQGDPRGGSLIFKIGARELYL